MESQMADSTTIIFNINSKQKIVPALGSCSNLQITYDCVECTLRSRNNSCFYCRNIVAHHTNRWHCKSDFCFGANNSLRSRNNSCLIIIAIERIVFVLRKRVIVVRVTVSLSIQSNYRLGLNCVSLILFFLKLFLMVRDTYSRH